MDGVGVIAVVGACEPERRAYAKRLAGRSSRALVPASELVGSPDPLEEAAVLASWRGGERGVVVEVPANAPAPEIVGTFVDRDDQTTLREIVCVVDAAHVLHDLDCDHCVPLRDAASAVAAPMVSSAHLLVTQIEFASVVVFVNWSRLSTPDLSVVMALAAALSPRARVTLEHSKSANAGAGEPYCIEQDRPGWMCVLNGDADPHVTDPRVSAVRYDDVRPFHPSRLMQVLDEQIVSGSCGRIIRSSGFCRLATRQHVIAHWEHVGRVFAMEPVALDEGLSAEDEPLAFGQDLAFIGIDLDSDGLNAALRAAALTDQELAAGPAVWQHFPDPFPEWATAADHHG